VFGLLSLLFLYSCHLGTIWRILSIAWGFSELVVASRHESQQVVSERPDSSLDRASIPRVLVAIWQRSCVNLRAALGLFVGSCVDLRTSFGLFVESNLVE